MDAEPRRAAAVAEGFSGILQNANFSTTDDGADEARTCV